MTTVFKREKNIFIDIGTDFSKSLIVSNKDNVAIDLTDWTINASMKRNYIAEDTVDFVAAITTAASGLISISLTDTISATLDEGRYVYDIVLTDDTGLKYKAFHGIATINSTVTL